MIRPRNGFAHPNSPLNGSNLPGSNASLVQGRSAVVAEHAGALLTGA